MIKFSNNIQTLEIFLFSLFWDFGVYLSFLLSLHLIKIAHIITDFLSHIFNTQLLTEVN